MRDTAAAAAPSAKGYLRIPRGRIRQERETEDSRPPFSARRSGDLRVAGGPASGSVDHARAGARAIGVRPNVTLPDKDANACQGDVLIGSGRDNPLHLLQLQIKGTSCRMRQNGAALLAHRYRAEPTATSLPSTAQDPIPKRFSSDTKRIRFS